MGGARRAARPTRENPDRSLALAGPEAAVASCANGPASCAWPSLLIVDEIGYLPVIQGGGNLIAVGGE